MKTNSPDIAGAAERRRRYNSKAAEAAKKWYDAEGRWVASSMPAEVRERYWLAVAVYDAGETALADSVIRGGDPWGIDQGIKWSFNIFHTNTSSVLLLKHGGVMAADVKQLLEVLVRQGFDKYMSNARPDFQFHGYNDNMPSEATMGLILGGELLGEKAPVEHGLWNLRQMASMLYRRGINSEWNSPTYSPVTLHCLAEVAEHAKNEEARELALKIEERLWLDFAGRFHPEIGVIAGPYSRAYYVDALAQLSLASSLFWTALGDIARPSPMELFEPDANGLVLHHEGDVPFNVAQMCVFTTAEYHVPEKALELFSRKSYPARAMATAEQGDCGPDKGACANRLETYLEKDFAVGTCALAFLGSEQNGYYCVLYKRKDTVESYKDVGVVYHKFLINDDVPGTIVQAADGQGRKYSNSGEKFINSYCSVQTVQSGPTVLVVNCPHPTLGGMEDGVPAKEITRLNEMIHFPAHHGGADEVRIGTRALDSWSGEARHGEWIGARLGKMLVAIRPAAYAPELGPVKITLEKINRYEVIRVTFYDGPARKFSRAELRKVFGGFVAEHASVEEYPSLAAFMEEVSGAAFTDQYCTTRRLRYRRPAGKARKALEMEISWSPGSLTPRFATVNGRTPSMDTRVEIDGLEEKDFPLLNEWKSVPSYFPWEKLVVPACKMVGYVADSE